MLEGGFRVAERRPIPLLAVVFLASKPRTVAWVWLSDTRLSGLGILISEATPAAQPPASPA